MERIIFRNRFTVHMLGLIAVMCLAVGGVILWVDHGRNSLLILGYTLGGTLLLLLLFWLAIVLAGRNLVAELILRDDGMQVEMVHFLGKGRKINLPIPPATDWGWYAQKPDPRNTRRVGVITFRSGGKIYKMSLHQAKIVDEVEFRKLAPTVVEEMVAGKVMVHKPA